MAHFHIPKPLHGWRELAGEVGIIVLGILIALGAEQMVESWQWNHKVGVVRTSIMRELGNDRARWEYMMKASPCMLREIDSLGRWLGDGAAPAKKPPAEVLANGPLLWMHWANWDLAKSSQSLDHFPLEEQLAFATAYDGIAHREATIEKATDLEGVVISLIPSASDPQDRRELQVALRQLGSAMGALRGNDGYMTRHFDALHVRPDSSDFAADMADAPACRS